jgi:hypothetical protein
MKGAAGLEDRNLAAVATGRTDDLMVSMNESF